MIEEGWQEVYRMLFAAGVASFAGVVSYLQQFVRPDRPVFSWMTFTIQVLTGALVGIMTYLLLAKRGVDWHLMSFLLLLAGWGGADTVVFFQEVFRGLVKRYADHIETKAASSGKGHQDVPGDLHDHDSPERSGGGGER